MNCKELNQDIKRLKSLRDLLKKKVDAATETGLGRIAIELAKDNATSATDQVLEKYMDDFCEKNPGLRLITFEKRIEGFVNVNGNPAWAYSISPIPGTDNLLIGGDEGTLYEYQKQLDGSYQLGKRIEGFVNTNGYPAWAHSISPIPGTDNLLIVGNNGELYEYQKQPDGSYRLGERIDGFVNAKGKPAWANSISPIPGTDNLLVGGNDGALCEYQKQPDGSYRLGKRINGFVAANGRPTRANSVSPIPGTDNLLIGGNNGALCEYQKQPDGSYRLGERIDGFVDAYGKPANASSVSPIPGTDNLLIGGEKGALYEYQKQLDGSYRLGERIDGFVDANGKPTWAYSISPIPGTDNLLIGGNDGALYEYQKQPDGSYRLGERIDGFVDANGKPTWAFPISLIPGTDNLLIGGNNGALYEYQKQPDGSYRLGERIDGFVNANGKPTRAKSISPIPGTDNLLIGGSSGALYEAHANNPSLSNLKKALPQIVHNN